MMSSLAFDERQVTQELESVSRPLRVAFGAACAERLLPAYATFSFRTGRGNPSLLNKILTDLWTDLAGSHMGDREILARIDDCMGLIPQEDDHPWVMEQAAAEDAGAATAYALRCLQNGRSQEAAWAARRAYEAIDHFVINREKVDLNVPGAGARVLAHPLVQAELRRQRRDLAELLKTSYEDPQRTSARLRVRAKAEGSLFFGPIASETS